MSSTTWPALPLLLLIHSKDDLLTKSAANLFPAVHNSLEESVQEPQRKTTFQCRLTLAAQEAEPTRERDEFKSKFGYYFAADAWFWLLSSLLVEILVWFCRNGDV